MRRLTTFLAIATGALLAGVLPAAASAATGTFSNTSPITIPDLDNGSPGDITVSGMTGVVTDVNVFVNGLSHTNPDDI